MNKHVIETRSKAELEAVLKVLYALGFSYHEKPDAKSAFEEYSAYPVVSVYIDTRTLGGDSRVYEENTCTTIDAVIKAVSQPASTRIEVQLSNEHRAVVTSEGVKVGCAEFGFDAIERLSTAVATVKRDAGLV